MRGILNVSFILRDKVRRLSTDRNFSEEKRGPKRYRTEVLRVPALPLGQTGSQKTRRELASLLIYCPVFRPFSHLKALIDSGMKTWLSPLPHVFRFVAMIDGASGKTNSYSVGGWRG